MVLKSQVVAIAFSALISVSSPVNASPFSESYAAYQQAIDAADTDAAVKYAKQVYELGQSYFERDSLDVIHLELNLATALQQNGDDELAFQHFDRVIKAYRKQVGSDAIELVDPLIGAAQTIAASEEKKPLFKQAIEIAEDAEKPLLVAELKMLTFNELAPTPFYTRDVRDYALEAHEIYSALLPADAIERVKATFSAGMIKAVEHKNSQAIEYLEEVVKQFSVLDYNHPYQLAAHARLVELYEAEGASNKSTQHCIAIGSMTPWNDSQEQTPLFRTPPRYPIAYARDSKEGWAQVSFTVDEQGFVRDPVLLASEGGKLFARESLKVIKQWRYAPKFVDGKPVAAEATVQLDFSLSR